MIRKALLLLSAFAVAGATALLIDLAVVLDQDQLQRRLDQVLAEVLAEPPEFDDVRVGLFEGLVLEGLRVGSRTGDGVRPFLEVRELRLTGSLLDLARGAPDTIVLQGPRIYLERDAEGAWNFERVLAGRKGEPPSATPELPRIRLEGGEVVLRLMAGPGDREGGAKPIERRFQLPSVVLDLDPTASGQGPHFRLAGDVRSEFFETGMVRIVGSAARLEGSLVLRKLGLTPELRELLPEPVRRTWNELNPRGAVDLEAGFRHSAGAEPAFDYEAVVQLFGAAVSLRDRPYAIEGLSGELRVSAGRVRFDSLTGTHGPTRASFRGELGFGVGDPGQLSIELRDVRIREEDLVALHEPERRVLEFFQPEGSVDIDLELRVPRSDGRPGADVVAQVRPIAASVRPRPFPLAVHFESGTVRIEEGKLALMDLRGTVAGGTITVSGSGGHRPDILESGDHHDVLAVASGIRLGEELRAALPPELREVWDGLRPHGLADAVVRFSKEAGGSPRRSVVLNFRETQVEPVVFAYPLTGLSGTIVAGEDTILIKDVAASAGPRLALEGTVWLPKGGGHPGFQLAVKAEQAAFDHRVRAAVGADMAKTLEDFGLQGQCNVALQVRKDPESRAAADFQEKPRPPELRWQLDLIDCRIRHARFPYPVEGVYGRVSVAPEGASFKYFRGFSGAARFEAEGWLPPAGGDPAGKLARFRIKGFDLALDGRLRSALPPEANTVLDELRAQGSVAAIADLVQREAGGALDQELTVSLQDLRCRPLRFDYPVEKIQGELRIAGGQVVLDGVTGRGPAVEGREPPVFRLDGELGQGESGRIALAAGIRGLPVDEALRRAAQDLVPGLWEEWQVEGAVDLALTAARDEGRRGLPAWTCAITGEDLGVRWSRLPWRLEQASVSLEASPERVRVLRFHGRRGEAKVSAEGLVVLAGPRAAAAVSSPAIGAPADVDAGQEGFRMRVSWEGLPLQDPELRESLPGTLRGALVSLDMSGPMGGDVTIRSTGPPAGRGLRYDGVLAPQGVDFAFGLPVKAARGRLDLQGELSALGEHRMSGTLGLADLAVLDKPVRSLTARFELGPGLVSREFLDRAFALPLSPALKDGLGRRQSLLALEGVRAEVLGGVAVGSAHVCFAQPMLYAVDFSMDRGRVEELLRDRFRDVSTVSGSLGGEAHFAGIGQDVGAIRGHGALRIRDGRLWDLPAFTRLLSLIAVGRAERAAFDRADVEFDIADARFKVKSIQFTSPALTLTGDGKVGFDGRVDLVLVTELGRPVLDQIPVVGDIWSFIKGNILRVGMSGSIEDPKVEPVVAAPVTEPIRRVFGDRD